jgi:hypothetical protein
VRTGALPIALWGLALAAIAVGGALGFGLALMPALVHTASGLGAVALGVWALRGRAGGGREIEASPSALAAAFGVTVLLVGLACSAPAFWWPALGLIAASLVGLLRETRGAGEGRG